MRAFGLPEGTLAAPSPLADHAREPLRESPHGLLALASDGTIAEVNTACAELFGYHPDELIGRSVCDTLVPAASRDAVRAAASETGAHDDAFVGRTRPFALLTAGGRELPVELTVTRQADPGGGWVCFVRDLDEVSLVARSAALANTVGRLTGVGSCEWDTATGESRFSEAMYALHGLDPEDGSPTFDAYVATVHPDDRPTLLEMMIASRAERDTTEAVSWRVQMPDGRTRRLAGSSAPLVWENGRAARVVSTIRDVTSEWMAAVELALHAAVTKALAGWEQETGVEALLREICAATGWTAGTLFFSPPGTRTLTAHTTWQGTPSGDGSYERDTRRARLRGGEGLPGRVLESGEPLSAWELHRRDPRALVRPWTPELASALAFPVTAPGFEGVLEFVTGHCGPIDDGLRRSLHAAGLQVGEFLARHRAELGDSPISKREREVLQMAAHGGTTASIAATLVVSPSTVKTHFEKIYGKLGVSDRAEAVAQGFRRGLVQ